MGRKDSKSSRTSRKRDDDSWGDGWEVTHTHTHAPHHRSCATAVQLIRESRVCQELCQPSALPPATVALHAGLPPIIPPGTELDISAADALPTEAEVRPGWRWQAQPSPHAKPSPLAKPQLQSPQVHVLREDGLSPTMISSANFLSAAECAAAEPASLRPHPPPPHPALELRGGRANGQRQVTKCVHTCSSGRCAAWIVWGEAAPFQLEKHAQTAHIAHRGEPSCPCPH